MNDHSMAHRKRFPSILRSFFLNRPSDVDTVNYPTFFALNIVTIGATIVHVGYFFFFLILEVKPLYLFNIISVTLWLLACYANRKGFHFPSLVIATTEILLHQSLCVIVIGWSSGFQYFILFVLVGVVIFPSGRMGYKILIGLFSCLNYLFLDYFFSTSLPIIDLGSNTLSPLYYTNFVVYFICMSGTLYYFGTIIVDTDKALRNEHKKSERLLLNILPKSIAERLKTGSEIIADRFDNVSILFLDIVQFTKMSEKISAQKVVSFLDRLFLIFDDLTEKYGLEKIKTIGDAYMVAAGIPEPCNDHAERLVKMSIDIKTALKDYNEQHGEDVKVRIGINSGPAVAGVIGRKKFAYDIWGDTVNTASRMEAYGEPDQVQVSEATYQLLQNKYEFIDRGTINVKGKGEMKTYFLNA